MPIDVKPIKIFFHFTKFKNRVSKNSYNGKRFFFQIFQMNGGKKRTCVKIPKYTEVTGIFLILYFMY